MSPTTVRWLGLGLVAAALIVAVPLTIIIGSADLGIATPAPTAPAPGSDSATPVPGFVTFGEDAALTVGSDVQPGIYRTRVFSPRCSWERWTPAGNTKALARGYAVVEILDTDSSFQSTGCREWSADLSAVTESSDRFGEGTMIVGTDLRPGVWTATPAVPELCSWSRLRGFTGEPSEAIEDDLAKRATLVIVIERTDVGFTSSGCGEWVRK